MLIVTKDKLPFKANYIGANFDLLFRHGQNGDIGNLTSVVESTIFLDESLDDASADLAMERSAGQPNPEVSMLHPIQIPQDVGFPENHRPIVMVVNVNSKPGPKTIEEDDFVIHRRGSRLKAGLQTVIPDLLLIEFGTDDLALRLLSNKARSNPNAHVYMFHNIDHVARKFAKP